MRTPSYPRKEVSTRMAHEQDPGEDYPRGTDDDVAPADLAFVSDELARLTFLKPDDPQTVPMPEWAWQRITSELARESAHRAADVGRSSRPSRLLRWGGGLAAASVAVVAIGAAVTLTGGPGPDVVAGEVPAASLLADAVPAVEEAEPVGAGASLDAGVLEGPQSLSFAGVPPVQMLVDSQMNYTADSLRSQVTSVMKRFGADERAKEPAAPAPPVIETASLPVTGFTASEQALRDCITKLTRFAGSTALMVDRSDFEGADAGVVVAPTYEASSPSPDMSRLQVWVVDPDCDVTMAIQITLTP